MGVTCQFKIQFKIQTGITVERIGIFDAVLFYVMILITAAIN